MIASSTRKPEQKILPLLNELGIAIAAYGVLSRGLLAGSKPGKTGDFRANLPRFAGENGERNQALVAALQQLAGEHGRSPAELAIAWVLARGPNIIPVIGARTRAQLAQALDALTLELSPADLERIESAVPAEAVGGTRYQEQQMAHLDSEK